MLLKKLVLVSAYSLVRNQFRNNGKLTSKTTLLKIKRLKIESQ